MKLIFKIVVSILLVFVLITAGGMLFLTRGLDGGRNLELSGIDLSSVSDGLYTGSYDAGRWTNQVNVTIKDHKIIDVEIVKDVLFRRPELTKGMIGKVIEHQNTNIDGISGATITCKAYLKAIENSFTH